MTAATWFRVSKYRYAIEVVATVVAVTEKTITYASDGGRPVRALRDCAWASYYPTWADARAAIIRREEIRVEAMRKNLRDAEASLHVVGLIPVVAP